LYLVLRHTRKYQLTIIVKYDNIIYTDYVERIDGGEVKAENIVFYVLCILPFQQSENKSKARIFCAVKVCVKLRVFLSKEKRENYEVLSLLRKTGGRQP